MIRAFIQFLSTEDMIDLNVIDHFGDKGFETRFKVQKYAYLARRCGLEHAYKYNMYRHGPYSPGLAQVYYDMTKHPEPDEALPDSFDKKRFLHIAKGKSNPWLEIATTLLDQRPDLTRAELVEHVAIIKNRHSEEYIKSVLDELQSIWPNLIKN